MKQHFKRNAFFYLLILGLAGFAGYQHFAHGWAMSKVKDAWEDNRQEVDFYTKQAMDSSNIGALQFATKTLVWAVRSELLSQNNQEVNRYILELEKDPNIKTVLICDTATVIQYASKAELIGQKIETIYPVLLRDKTDISTEIGKDGEFYWIAPIMGLNTRIGTLFYTYQHTMPQINRKMNAFQLE